MRGLFGKGGWFSRRRGTWGENRACAFLEAKGWKVLERNVRPVKGDRRCEIDIVAMRPEDEGVVFVEVKTHFAHSDKASRIWGVDYRKKGVLLRACSNWLMIHKWHGNYRFDVIEIYGGMDGGEAEIDHIENVPLFGAKWRFW